LVDFAFLLYDQINNNSRYEILRIFNKIQMLTGPVKPSLHTKYFRGRLLIVGQLCSVYTESEFNANYCKLLHLFHWSC